MSTPHANSVLERATANLRAAQITEPEKPQPKQDSIHLSRALANLKANQPQKKPTVYKRRNKGGFPGVYYQKARCKWDVFVTVDGVKHWCGSVDEEADGPAMQEAKKQELKSAK